MSFSFRNLFTALVNCLYTLNIGCFTQVHISEKRYIAEKETGKKKQHCDAKDIFWRNYGY